MRFPRGRQLSDLIVAQFIAVWILYFAYIHTGGIGRPVIILVAIYEAYTVVNAFPNDTLSESVWRLTVGRPFIPWIFGYATCYAVMLGYLQDPHLALGMGFLQGHFFFQRYQAQQEDEAGV